MAMLRLPTATPGAAANGVVRQWKREGLLLFPIVERTAVVNLGDGTPVRSTNILVVGATGTLGRQIVRRALDEGYDVRCLVRPRPAPADFLRDWGATVVNADLTKPETIPATLVGVHTVIDCATGRPEEPIKTVDWEGKVALIQCAKAM
ncbi:rossmann-fold NAD(P)-binding domain-containing protein, partial [Trifolium medium]|nr:rossmann-fold NAD(P)-binding domain-containing protein [Trifolium medium]